LAINQQGQQASSKSMVMQRDSNSIHCQLQLLPCCKQQCQKKQNYLTSNNQLVANRDSNSKQPKHSDISNSMNGTETVNNIWQQQDKMS